VTPLADLLAARIAQTGPITVADFMAEALMHPAHGYYATRDPFGRAGDFVTAPEISQMFGELLGVCLALAWLDQGAPAPFTLAELGPGRGTLMADLWRATALVPGFHAAAQVCLVEASPVLRAAQSARLPMARHADRVEDLAEGPLFLVANEFLDALPIRQFRRGADGWREVVVGLDGAALAFGLSPPVPCPDPRFAADPPGTVVELCPALPGIAQAVAGRLARGGAAIFVDYGGWRSKGDTLQALRAHAPEAPLAHPGEADLTAHVDFEALALALAPLPVAGPVPQGPLLVRLGLAARAARLARNLAGARRAAHLAAAHRLTAPGEMGSLFQALAVHAPGSPPPPGFA
jgi:SAM-dependent MidA family methyltransferase